MKAKKIWIARHPDEPHNCEFKLHEPRDPGVYIYANSDNHEDCYCNWKEYVMLEVDDG